jgi:uncharacterized membrane protein
MATRRRYSGWYHSCLAFQRVLNSSRGLAMVTEVPVIFYNFSRQISAQYLNRSRSLPSKSFPFTFFTVQRFSWKVSPIILIIITIIIPLYIRLPYFLRVFLFLFISQGSEYLSNTKGSRPQYTLLFLALVLVGLCTSVLSRVLVTIQRWGLDW